MMPARSSQRPAFTLPELLVVIGILILLMAILIPVLGTARRSGSMASSGSNLRQIATMITQYATEHRDQVLPSQFDYSGAQYTYKGKVRSNQPNVGDKHEGTWTDILWTINELSPFPESLATDTPLGHRYSVDSPDEVFYDYDEDYDGNPFRSTLRNSDDSNGDGVETPFGTGANANTHPGFFAANDFFNARPDAPGNTNLAGRWYVMGQIRAPDRSLYLVDSIAGEIIGGADGANFTFDVDFDVDGGTSPVDFRYNDAALILYLDGHQAPEGPWVDLADLEGNRQIRVTNLTTN